MYDDANRLALQAVTLLLQSRLNDAIREELGATYSITVESQASQDPEAGISRADQLDLRSRARRRASSSA